MKKFLSVFLKNVYAGIISAVIGGAFLAAHFLIPDYIFGSISEAIFNVPTLAFCTDGGMNYYVDANETLYAVNEHGEADFLIDIRDLPCKNSSITDAAADANGNVYLLATVVNEDAYLTDMDVIYEYDSTGNYVREVCRFDYRGSDDQPHRSSNVLGLNVYDGRLRFVYSEKAGEAVIMSCGLNDSFITEDAAVDIPEFSGFHSLNAGENGGYISALTDGTVIEISPDGSVNEICNADFDIYEGGFMPYTAVMCGGKIYAAEGFDGQSLYLLGDDGPELIMTTDEITDDEYSYISDIYNFNGELAFAVDDTVYINGDDGLTAVNGGFTIPFRYSLLVVLRGISLYAAAFFLLWGTVSLIGCVFRWRLTLMAKQIFLTVPVVLIMLGAVVAGMLKNIKDTYNDDMERLMTAINEISVKLLDGDEIEKMTTLECASDGSLYELHKTLEDIVDSNKSSWNRNFDSSVYLYSDDGIYPAIAFSDSYSMPFQVYTYGNDELEDAKMSDNGTIISYSYSINFTSMTAGTPIYNSKGEEVAIFELSADLGTVEDNINKLIKQALLYIAAYIPFLIAAVVLVSFISVRYLRRASSAVAKIAGGDFSVRIDKSPKDEVGEICSSVNNMADQLEVFFEQKDKNEKFYYKFVPEKFRELLHKDSFTDLSLGDAESADLTVLFCDIRSFSLNSEMMTAKENFEFVNIIYGKAGPIIRNHGGFVDKYIGDAVMALFENADDAVAAGIELYREIALDPKTAEELGVSSINIGIGIHSGMARIGIVGEDERMSGTVISNTVNLSSRLESLTKKYNAAMLISKDTLDRMSDPDSLNTRYLGMIQVAGVNEVKALYEVLDCLDDVRKNERTSTKADFREAVRLFHLGNLKESLELFEKIDSVSTCDPALKMYMDTIKQKLETGDYEHNVFRFSRK